MTARIYQPTKSVTQSGRASRHWVLEYAEDGKRNNDDLMGWSDSADTQAQVKIKFSNRDDAVNYARKNGLGFDLEEPQERRVRPKSYTDNFIRKV